MTLADSTGGGGRPHPFGLENPSSAIAGRAPNYLDNLMVVGRLLAEVEDTLTRAGRWDQSTLVVTSDHSLRSWYWEGSGAWTDEEQHATGGRQSPHVPFVKHPTDVNAHRPARVAGS